MTDKEAAANERSKKGERETQYSLCCPNVALFRAISDASACCLSKENDDGEPFNERLQRIKRPLKKDRITVIQVNVGNLCNQACIHCHVSASPGSTHIMSQDVLEKVVVLLKSNPGLSLDITGGAPELHPGIEEFVIKCSRYAETISFRSNLTALLDNRHLIGLFRQCNVQLVCSLPDISSEKTDYQRGKGVFEKSINTLRILNQAGYGKEFVLHLVHNPTGIQLPELQEIIENKYKEHLKEEYGIIFNNLYILNNMPIGRFRSLLERQRMLKIYTRTLASSFNTSTLNGLMCRYVLNIGWDGTLYDCDFNNAAGLPLKNAACLQDLNLESLIGGDIATDDHCYGCSAVKGSGCFGKPAED